MVGSFRFWVIGLCLFLFFFEVNLVVFAWVFMLLREDIGIVVIGGVG